MAQALMGHLLGARTWAETWLVCSPLILTLTTTPILQLGKLAQRGRVPCSVSHSESAAELGFEPGSVIYRGLALSSSHKASPKMRVTEAVGSLLWLLARVGDSGAWGQRPGSWQGPLQTAQ